MRKEYVKPVMESEEFVSNEYVAACSTIKCTKCNAMDEVYKGVSDVTSGLTMLAEDGTSSLYIYPDDLDGATTCTDVTIGGGKPEWIDKIYEGNNPFNPGSIWEELVWLGYQIFVGNNTTVKSYHPVTVIKGHNNGANPNASV